MFLRQLEYLATLAREKHFARAAEACHVSQPALSSGIRSLEKELGVVIVQRGRRFVGFTSEGERVLAWAQQTLASLTNMREDATADKSSMAGLLRWVPFQPQCRSPPILPPRAAALIRISATALSR